MNESKSFLRNVIGEYMAELGSKHENLVVVNADLSGTCRNKSFVEKYPNRAFNVGIAEQNMVSFAAGLACEGFKPFVFSMAPFLTMRACEQCRTDVAYGNRNVKMIGVYAGVSGGISGATHWSIEDVGIMTSMPNVKVFEVSDKIQTEKILELISNIDSPVYLRSSVEPTLDIYDTNLDVKIGGSTIVKDGNDGAILCSGVIVQYALEASNNIEKKFGKKIRVVDMYSIKPIDENAIIEACKTKHVLVAQDHNVYGGLGTMVSSVIAKNNLNTEFISLGIRDEYLSMAHAKYLYKKYELDSEGIEKNMMSILGENGLL